LHAYEQSIKSRVAKEIDAARKKGGEQILVEVDALAAKHVSVQGQEAVHDFRAAVQRVFPEAGTNKAAALRTAVEFGKVAGKRKRGALVVPWSERWIEREHQPTSIKVARAGSTASASSLTSPSSTASGTSKPAACEYEGVGVVGVETLPTLGDHGSGGSSSSSSGGGGGGGGGERRSISQSPQLVQCGVTATCSDGSSSGVGGLTGDVFIRGSSGPDEAVTSEPCLICGVQVETAPSEGAGLNMYAHLSTCYGSTDDPNA
jgi:hypothetical protein